MIDAFDDLATAKPPFKVIAVVPVLGRLPLLEHTIRRLYDKNDCYHVICVGHGSKERELCESLEAEWVHHENQPLGAKWNKGFTAAKRFNPDACLYVGSSDWLCNQWITIMKPHLDLHQMVGVPGMHLLDFGKTMRAVRWDGYTGSRADESIGIGRMLSGKLLDKLDWRPFSDVIDNSLDRSMKDRSRALGHADVMIYDKRLIACSLSTDQWLNKHKFEAHWPGDDKDFGGAMPSHKVNVQELTKLFPEANELCESLKAMSVSR